MPVLSTRKRHLPDSITKNTSITLFLNYTISNLTNKLAIDAKLSLINRIPLKLYIVVVDSLINV